MLKTSLITLAVLGIIAAGGVVWAKQSGYCSPENRIQNVTDRIGRRLDRNDDQQGRLEALAETLRGLRNAQQDHRAAMKESLMELLSELSLDRDRAIALIDERFESMNESKLSLVDAFAEFSDSLAPEQRSRLADLIGDRMTAHWGRHRWAQ